MRFFQPGASLYIPDGQAPADALPRTTHLGIGAHSDDLEIMAFHGIKLCYEKENMWFGGVTCTNNSGSVRTGKYAEMSDDDMMTLRKEEQVRAAKMGKYGFMAQLDFPSIDIKDRDNRSLENDLTSILWLTQPELVYTHNPADKHDTHIGVFVAVIRAIRNLPVTQRPGQVYGCEVWRGLDWLPDEDKVALDVSDPDKLGRSLVAIFDSQIAGGKRYDKAILGRNHANATFYRPREVDGPSQLTFAMDLSPLAADDSLDIKEFVLARVNRFKLDVENKLRAQLL